MPHVVFEKNNLLETPLKKGDIEFLFTAQSYHPKGSSRKIEYKIATKNKDLEFLLAIKEKDENYIIKSDKTTRVSPVSYIKDALNSYVLENKSNILFKNTTNLKEKKEQEHKYLKDIDFFVEDFKSDKELQIEIGFGSGRHLLYQAKQNPNIQFIGLEIHCELKTKTKMFCACKNDPEEAQPNVNICPVCMGHPGTLPVINKKAVEMVIKTGLALNCEIAKETHFERKNYFYPDLPKGYQISQYVLPLCSGGYLKIPNTDRTIRITRIHLEEDTGKLLHFQGEDYSLIDFNRAGLPLMELVTEPDIRSAKEARQFAEELQLILRYLGVSDADMEKGQMRVEVNISLTNTNDNSGKLGTKVEIKNLNSFRAVEKAIEYEIKRQSNLLEKDEKVIQETRGWDSVKGKTFSQRIKEEANDYRYFPEPDLPPLSFSSIKDIKDSIPELPQQKRARFQKEYNITSKEVEVLVQNKDLADYFEEVVSELKDWAKTKKIDQSKISSLIKLAVNYLESDLLGLMKEKNILIKNLKITPENFAELITILWRGEVSSRAGKDVLLEMFKTGADPTYIIQDKNLKQVSDEGAIEEIARKIIKENPKAVSDYKEGKENALQFLVGQVMKESRGKANPDKARQIFKKLL